MLFENPDWEKWALIPKAKLGAAVWLSLNVEPYPYVEDILFPGALRRQYKERLAIANGNLAATGPLIPITASITEGESEVSLAAFFVWTHSMGWRLPEEALALQAGVSASSTPNAAEREDSLAKQYALLLKKLASLEKKHDLLYKQLGLLALTLYECKSSFQHGGKVNCKQVGIAAHELAVKVKDNRNIKGLGVSSLRASIQEGIDRLDL
ncbi:hypothetical protein [Silvimonas amylolytica]|uniref:Uncharacterized protein n=1 Tax=Silvimonas amylolytica TaxID=449663 RepID=A0ABQ2PGU4_9NEIS|nr:hypothetical protein [Silvimonas amylolytica]GGP24829.1 hypothetical protein GCM10010971_06480 [Silvimonas amylolytica]